MATLGTSAILPGWRVRVLDGTHLPASEKRLAPLRGFRGAALPGQSLVVYDPDLGLVTDLVACEDAHASERAAVAPLLEGARPGELWIAAKSRNRANPADSADLRGIAISAPARCCKAFRTWEPVSSCASTAQTSGFATPTLPVWSNKGNGRAVAAPKRARCASKRLQLPRRIELALDQPTEDGDATMRLWSNLPSTVGAEQAAAPYRTRWRIGGMFGRLEAVLHSEVSSLGHPRAALLGFAAAVLAYNVLALLQRVVEQACQQSSAPPLKVSCFHLAVQVRGSYEGLLIALPPEHWPHWNDADPAGLAQHLLRLARNINPQQVATSKRDPKAAKPKSYGDGKTARAHVATARLLAPAKTTP